jgi:hypothetical protein
VLQGCRPLPWARLHGTRRTGAGPVPLEIWKLQERHGHGTGATRLLPLKNGRHGHLTDTFKVFKFSLHLAWELGAAFCSPHKYFVLILCPSSTLRPRRRLDDHPPAIAELHFSSTRLCRGVLAGVFFRRDRVGGLFYRLLLQRFQQTTDRGASVTSAFCAISTLILKPQLPMWKRDSPSSSPSGLGPVTRVEQIFQHNASFYFIPSCPLFIFYISSFHYRFALQLRGHVIIIAPPRYLFLHATDIARTPLELKTRSGARSRTHITLVFFFSFFSLHSLPLSPYFPHLVAISSDHSIPRARFLFARAGDLLHGSASLSTRPTHHSALLGTNYLFFTDHLTRRNSSSQGLLRSAFDESNPVSFSFNLGSSGCIGTWSSRP